MASSRPLGDAPDRSYADKLERFARFAEPELKQIFAGFGLSPGAAVLDLGCGTGLSTGWLAQACGGEGRVIGADLSLLHLQAARRDEGFAIVQADAAHPCFGPRTFDLIWCCNTMNHVADPLDALAALRPLLQPFGRLVLAQGGFVSEMFFAWDKALDEAVRAACHRCYRERYGLTSADTARSRGLVGQMLAAGFRDVRVHTHVIERMQPLSPADRDYFRVAIFDGVWGSRIRPYLAPEEWNQLQRYCEAGSRDYCLDRADFHHIQTLTVCEGREMRAPR